MKLSLVAILFFLIACKQETSVKTQSFVYQDKLVTVKRFIEKVSPNKIKVSLKISGLKNNCADCPFFMTDTLTYGVNTILDESCTYKGKLKKNNGVGFSLISPLPIPDTLTLTYFFDPNGIKKINIDGDVAYHPQRVLTLLNTDCSVNF